MDRLLEIGEIGLLRNIPEEIEILTNEIRILTSENSTLRLYLRIGVFALAGFALYRLIVGTNNESENDEYIDS